MKNIDLLKSSNLKKTKCREIILDIFKNSKVPLSAQDIYETIDKQYSKNSEINLATIYRNLNLLTEKDILINSIHGDSKTYYELNDHIHRHCLICDVCHKTIEIDGCPIEKLAIKVSKDTGYVITSHFLQLRGTCPNCLNIIKKEENSK